VFATLASLGALVQIPLLSRLLNLRPLHGADWALVAAAFAASVGIALAVGSRLNRDRD
jgi:Ca2+-transporting ATPase